eukprot:CAMPEP_0113425584 /NCGR_PEP_ID=MMETSP0013_2-20120614/30250_1 /TAXON_ID=2843 ORGANISM="Skeletonema costatum, Strain 1716" /NCGR_SAMPLE_ID=MMETSP0013_2 /ASSEMBLY_ACC=CAM_ASM_000158 /LENGTH=41 /DNA_ID=CAMNT_0000313761 /DNA_START=78 /DNA_END=200 /DNA_ORIENTATION=+ /assembly_acc=CAM_ASM_000158
MNRPMRQVRHKQDEEKPQQNLTDKTTKQQQRQPSSLRQNAT